MLGGIARETSRIRLGTLVSSATFRLPAILALQVANVDEMSGGRAELGLGAGWHEVEHETYGVPFPTRRFDRLEEQLAIVTGLWGTPAGSTFDFDGEFYRLRDGPALPRPVQERVPIIIGGRGPSRTPELAARFASEYNYFAQEGDGIRARFDVVRAAATEVGRDPAGMRLSIATSLGHGIPLSEVRERVARAREADCDRIYL